MLQKVAAKVWRDDENVWVHFCYVPTELKQRFDEKVNTKNQSLDTWIRIWAKEDFGYDKMEDYVHLEQLKKAVKLKFKIEFPEVYVDSDSDRQGWLRIWLSRHMREEIKNVRSNT